MPAMYAMVVTEMVDGEETVVMFMRQHNQDEAEEIMKEHVKAPQKGYVFEMLSLWGGHEDPAQTKLDV